MSKPDFDPSQPFQTLPEDTPAQATGPKPAFDPSQPYSAAPAQAQAGTPDNPILTDVYKSNAARTASSFGNPKGMAKTLIANGFLDAKKNASGDLVVKDKDGNWYKDDDRFLDHPINWAESHLGGALPMGGMMAGEAAGAASGLGTAGTTSLPGAALGGGLGSAGGEALRQMVGRNLGTYDNGLGESVNDVAGEGVLGMGGALVNKGVIEPVAKAAAPYLKPILEGAGNMVKRGVSGISSMMTGVPREAIEQLIERPTQVLGANAPGQVLSVAQKANAELMARNEAEKQAISAARKAAVAKYGDTQIPTEDMVGQINSFLADKAPVPGIQGALNPSETANLQQIAGEGLTQNGQQARSFADMQKLADQIKAQKSGVFNGSALPGGTTANKGQLSNLYGQVKGAMHGISPELDAADQQYSHFADQSKLLAPIEDPAKMEAFVNNYFGPNKTVMHEAASNVIPNSMNDIEDIGASRAFTKQGPAGSSMGSRNLLSAGGGGTVLGAGMMTGHPVVGALGGGAMAAATNPEVHKQIIGRASQMLESPFMQAVAANPQLLKFITNPALKRYAESALESGASKSFLPAAGQSQPENNEVSGPDQSRLMPLQQAQQKFINENQ